MPSWYDVGRRWYGSGLVLSGMALVWYWDVIGIAQLKIQIFEFSAVYVWYFVDMALVLER